MKAWPDETSPFVRLLFPLYVPALLAALIFGGGTKQGLMSDAIVQIACLPLFVVTLATLTEIPIGRHLRYVLALCGLLVALPLLQLIPLPSGLWTALPGRDAFAAAYESAGMALPALPLSLDAEATWRSFFSLIPGLSIFLASLLLTRRQFHLTLIIAIAFGIASVLVGLAQLASPSQALRMFDLRLDSEAVGFFTGRNNFAALLYSLLPVAIVGVIIFLRRGSPLAAGFCALACLILTFGLVMARSRAGFGLGLLGAFGAGGIILLESDPQQRRRTALIMGGIAVISLLGFLQIGFQRVLSRFGSSSAEDLRGPIAETTLQAIAHYFPAGSGLGTFVPIYQMFQGIDTLVQPYINHAHNDLLENVLEGGLPALLIAVLITAYLVWCGFLVLARYPQPSDPTERTIARVALVVIADFLLHSMVEYPLRTEALMAFGGIACAALMRPLTIARPPEPARARAPEQPQTPDKPSSSSPKRTRRRRRRSRRGWLDQFGFR